MENIPNPKISKWLQLLKALGDIRDGFLITLSILYFLGYLIWSINAWRYNLGLLPALNAQYIVAGAIPAIVIVIFFFLLRAIHTLIRKAENWLKEYEEKILKQRDQKGIGIFRAGMVIGLRAGLSPMDDEFINNVISTIVILGIVVIYLYAIVAYPTFPQEFGGVRPRCAFIDVLPSQVSNETLAALLPSGTTNTITHVIRSEKVNVFYYTKDFMLLAPYSMPPKPHSEVYELGMNVIQSVTWCSSP